MVIPPQPVVNPPYAPVKPGDITKGAKLDLIDLADVLAGGCPGTLWTNTATDQVDMAAVPAGLYRCVQLAHAFGIAGGQQLNLYIQRMGVWYPIATSKNELISNINLQPVTYGFESSTCQQKAFIMQPGDILTAFDEQAAGVDVTLSVMFVDVFL
jgi:hypothetical protein